MLRRMVNLKVVKIMAKKLYACLHCGYVCDINKVKETKDRVDSDGGYRVWHVAHGFNILRLAQNAANLLVRDQYDL